MVLTLEASPNVYSWEDHSKFPIEKQEIRVSSYEQARQHTLEFIKKYDLGGSNISSGKIFENGKLIAKVTYGGRVIFPDDEFFRFM